MSRKASHTYLNSQAVKQALKERQESLKSRVAGKKEKAVAPTQDDLPKAPKKPSFCTEEDTTQFYFDGCMVQVSSCHLSSHHPSWVFDESADPYHSDLRGGIYSQLQSGFCRRAL